MKTTLKRVKQLALVMMLAGLGLLPASASAQGETPYPPPVPEEPPFILPFAEEPGPGTWFVGQWYGSTVLAFRQRQVWYAAGQGLHFGLDMSAPCGTEVLAVGDGTVAKVDATRHGAGPHNLMINHDNGFASFYGHLLEKPRLAVGQRVAAGDVVALTGDPDLTCTSRPHLHLEIRDDRYGYAYNPVLFIDADWDTLALFSPFGAFQRDLDAPRQWASLWDQPRVVFGGTLLNNYARPWPPEFLR